MDEVKSAKRPLDIAQNSLLERDRPGKSPMDVDPETTGFLGRDRSPSGPSPVPLEL